jgi:hypothetical protein
VPQPYAKHSPKPSLVDRAHLSRQLDHTRWFSADPATLGSVPVRHARPGHSIPILPRARTAPLQGVGERLFRVLQSVTLPLQQPGNEVHEVLRIYRLDDVVLETSLQHAIAIGGAGIRGQRNGRNLREPLADARQQ